MKTINKQLQVRIDMEKFLGKWISSFFVTVNLLFQGQRKKD